MWKGALMWETIKWVLWPLRSRKAQIALATLITAYLARAGWDVSEETVGYIIMVGITWIAAIAGEDMAAKRAGTGTVGNLGNVPNLPTEPQPPVQVSVEQPAPQDMPPAP